MSRSSTERWTGNDTCDCNIGGPHSDRLAAPSPPSQMSSPGATLPGEAHTDTDRVGGMVRPLSILTQVPAPVRKELRCART